jgi:hypothetical protein
LEAPSPGLSKLTESRGSDTNSLVTFYQVFLRIKVLMYTVHAGRDSSCTTFDSTDNRTIMAPVPLLTVASGHCQTRHPSIGAY